MLSGILYVGVPALRSDRDRSPDAAETEALPAGAAGLPRAVARTLAASDAAFDQGNAIAAAEPLIELWQSEWITLELAPIVRERLVRALAAGAADAFAAGDSVRADRFVGLLRELKRAEIVERASRGG